MKKAFSAVVAILLCSVFVLSGCNDNNTNTPGSVDFGDDKPISDIKIVEGETIYEEKVAKEAEIFMNGFYSMKATIYSSGQKIPVLLAQDGKNIEFALEAGSLSFGVLLLDEASYIILPSTKEYTELSDSFMKLLGLDDVKLSDLQSIRNDEGSDDGKHRQSSVTINGKPGVCNEFDYDSTVIKLYSIDDKLIQIDSYDENGQLSMQIVVDSITDQIPSDQLTIKGYSKVNAQSFIKMLTNLAA